MVESKVRAQPLRGLCPGFSQSALRLVLGLLQSHWVGHMHSAPGRTPCTPKCRGTEQQLCPGMRAWQKHGSSYSATSSEAEPESQRLSWARFLLGSCWQHSRAGPGRVCKITALTRERSEGPRNSGSGAQLTFSRPTHTSAPLSGAREPRVRHRQWQLSYKELCLWFRVCTSRKEGNFAEGEERVCASLSGPQRCQWKKEIVTYSVTS